MCNNVSAQLAESVKLLHMFHKAPDPPTSVSSLPGVAPLVKTCPASPTPTSAPARGVHSWFSTSWQLFTSIKEGIKISEFDVSENISAIEANGETVTF